MTDPRAPGAPPAAPSLLDPARVPADDRGFLLGDGVFETVRVYGGVPFRLRAHLDRLAHAAGVLGLPLPGDLEARVRRFVDRGGEDVGEAALRITVTRGRGGDLAGLPAAAEPTREPVASPAPTIALRLLPLDARRIVGGRGSETARSAPSDHEPPRGLSAVIEGRVHEGALAAAIKGTGFLERILALRRARARGADEALLRNARGDLVEGSASNLIAVLAADTLVAPGPEEGALAGITRGVVLELAEEMGFRIEERGLSPDELPGVRELLLTSSIRQVAGVTSVEGVAIGAEAPIGEGAPDGGEAPRAAGAPIGVSGPGPVARRFHEAFRGVVARETGSAPERASPSSAPNDERPV